MSIVLDDREQNLAAPSGLEFLPPSVLSRREPVLRLAVPVEAPAEQDETNVVQARDLIERQPSSPAAWARLSQAELAVGNRSAAAAAALAALGRMERSESGPALAAAVVLVACDHLDDAEEALRRLSSVGSSGKKELSPPLLAFWAGLAAARHDFDHALEILSGVKSAEADAMRGWVELQRGNYRKAIKFYRHALRDGPPDPATLTNIGYAHAALGQRERAIRDTQYALSLAPAERSRVGLNLVAYYVSEGRFKKAMELLRALQADAPRDLDLRFAEAHLHFIAEKPERSRQVLQRARTTLWAHLSEVQQAELSANLTFVLWRLQKRTNTEAAKEIVRDLEGVDFAAVRVAEMLPALLDRFSDSRVLNRVLTRTQQANPDRQLFCLEAHAALLDHRFDEAVEISVRWAGTAPLSPVAATAATFLLADLADDPGQAVEIGLPALNRMPSAKSLANNVAYSLALVGRAEEARTVLPEDSSPQALTTAGLVALRLGETHRAIDRYRVAHQRAEKNDDGDLAALIVLHARMAVHCFAPELGDEALGLPEFVLPDGWEDKPRFAIALEMLKRKGIADPTTA